MKKLGLLICVVSAAASVGLGYSFTQRLEAEVSGGPKVPILVAAADIPVAATLTENMLALRDVPRAYLESRHIQATDMKKVVGQRVIEGLKANEALMASDIAKFSERKQLSGLVANGMRALALEGRSIDFDGLLRPGDRVDVLLSTGNDNGGSTSTLLQNLLVLSVGGTLEKSDTDQQTYSRGATVAVSATTDQAQVLTEALRRGKLTLTLRNTEDMTILEGIAETNSNDLLNRNAQPQRVIATVAPAAKPAAAALKEGPNHVR